MGGWLDELQERAGPLRSAAREFCTARRIDPDARGVDAARALGSALDAFCHEAEDDDPYQEDRFIEGAGAYLGLLVLDAHGGPGHAHIEARHRVLLGPHGCFDPFAAIDAALDAEQPLLALADSLALAEAEAHGAGPVSTLVAALDRALHAAGTGRSLTRRFELEVELDDGTQIDLRRVASGATWPHSDQERRRLARDVERLVGMLPGRRSQRPGAEGGLTADEVVACLGRLLPRPVSTDFGAGLPEGVALATASLAADVALAFVEQHPGRARFLRADELGSLGGVEAVRLHALENLRRRSQHMRFEPLLVGGHRWLAGKSGDGLDAARVVLLEAHAHARALLPETALAVIPHRDTILFGPRRDAAALERYAQDLMARAPHPISARAIPLPRKDP